MLSHKFNKSNLVVALIVAVILTCIVYVGVIWMSVKFV